MRTSDDDRLEELEAHDRAHSRPPAGPPFQAAYHRVAVQVLAPLPDIQESGARPYLLEIQSLVA